MVTYGPSSGQVQPIFFAHQEDPINGVLRGAGFWLPFYMCLILGCHQKVAGFMPKKSGDDQRHGAPCLEF